MDDKQRAQVGAQVRQARKRHPWTVKELAREAGVAANTVTAVELGRKVRPGNLRAVLDALAIDPLAEQAGHGDDAVSADVELASAVVAQWLRRQDGPTREQMIRELMRMVARS